MSKLLPKALRYLTICAAISTFAFATYCYGAFNAGVSFRHDYYCGASARAVLGKLYAYTEQGGQAEKASRMLMDYYTGEARGCIVMDEEKAQELKRQWIAEKVQT